MQIYGPFRVQSTTPPRSGAPASRAATPNQSTSSGPVDQLDLSSAAQQTNRLSGASAGGEGDIRAERVAAIRRAIADGSYETPEKLDIALDRFLDELG